MIAQLDPGPYRDLLAILALISGGVAAFLRIWRVDKAWREYAEAVGAANVTLQAEVQTTRVELDRTRLELHRAETRVALLQAQVDDLQAQITVLQTRAVERGETT